MLSMHDNEQYLFEALRAGASGYVLKTAADRDLVEACRAVLRGQPFLYPSGIAVLIRDFLDRARDGEELPADPLTPRELEVVKLVAEAHTSEQIAHAARALAQDGRAPSRARAGQARHARPRRADALRDPPRTRRAVGVARLASPREASVGSVPRRCGLDDPWFAWCSRPPVRRDPRVDGLEPPASSLGRRGRVVDAHRGAPAANEPRRRADHPDARGERPITAAAWDWVCELHLLDGADAGDCLKHPACAEWLGDLRLLGMRPMVAVLGPPRRSADGRRDRAVRRRARR